MSAVLPSYAALIISFEAQIISCIALGQAPTLSGTQEVASLVQKDVTATAYNLWDLPLRPDPQSSFIRSE